MLKNTKKKRSGKLHYAWIILLGCCILQGGTLGAITNIAGIFYVPVCTELNFAVGELSLYRTIMGLVSLATLPAVSKLLNKYDSRIVLSLAAVVFIVPTIAMSRFTSLVQWYIAGAIQGFSSNFICIVAGPLILTNWFRKKTGLVIGISTAAAGLSGATFNYLVSAIIETSGWRMGYLISGAAALVVVLIASVFIIRFRPEEMGLQPFGEEDAEVKRVSPQQITQLPEPQRKRRLLMMLTAAVCAGVVGAFSSFFNPFGISVGLSVSAAAVLASVSMIGNTAGKLILGEMNDRIGTRWSCLAGFTVALVGAVLMITTKAPVLYFSALIFGVSMPVYSTLLPLMTRAALGGSDFSANYAKVTMASSMTASVMLTAHGTLFDLTGSYTCSMILCALTMALGSILTLQLFWKEPSGQIV